MTDEADTDANALPDEKDRSPPVPPPKDRSYVGGWTGRIALGVAVLCGIGLGLAFFSAASDKGSSLLSQLGLAAIGLIAVATAIIANRDMALSLANPRSWLTRANLAGLVMALLFGTTTVATLLPLVEPSVVVESPPGVIQDTVVDIAETLEARLPAPPEMAPIRARLPGLWGEAGCEVVWRIDLEDAALSAEVVQRPEGLPPYRLVGSVTAEEGLVLHMVGESPDAAKGMAATFSLDETGAAPRLAWTDRTRAVPLVLEPCGE